MADGPVLRAVVGVVDRPGRVGALPSVLPDCRGRGVRGRVGAQAGGGLPVHVPARVRVGGWRRRAPAP